jgi:hypothetical protein
MLAHHATPYVLSKNITGLNKKQATKCRPTKSRPENLSMAEENEAYTEKGTHNHQLSACVCSQVPINHATLLPPTPPQICDFFSLSSSSFIPFMIHPLDFLAYSSAASLFFIIAFILLKSSGTFMPLWTAGRCSIVSSQVLISGKLLGSTPAHSPQLTVEETRLVSTKQQNFRSFVFASRASNTCL